MKLSLAWLQDWVDCQNMTPDALSELLTMAGLEVDGVEALTPSFSDVLIGEVLKTEPHPDANKLKVCQVSIGPNDPLTIVCGAKNVTSGQKVPVAIVGARLPGDVHIKAVTLRGVPSQGMICASDELGLEADSDGIMVLGVDAPTGQSFSDWLALPDVIYDLAITPNRGDCFSLCGVAREVSAFIGKPWKMPSLSSVTTKGSEYHQVHLESSLCLSYASCVVAHIDSSIPTPAFITNRLKRAGQGLNHVVVDIINYVMLETGRPMHAFDLESLRGDITVGLSQGEVFHALDKSERTLDNETLIIKDESRVLAIAGVIGGLDSAVHSDTQHILIECARFNPAALSRSTRTHRYHTESSHRLERGVDPSMQVVAIQRVLALIQSIMPDAVISEINQVGDKQAETKPAIVVSYSEIPRILGIDLDQKQIISYLSALEFEVQCDEETFAVKVPPHRHDISIPVDIIEELARLIGYDQLPMGDALPFAQCSYPVTEKVRVSQYLQHHGFHEAICLNMLSEDTLNDFYENMPLIALENPLNSNMTHLRHSLLPGLIQSLVYNESRQQNRVRLFEVGNCFTELDQGIQQSLKLAGVATGERVASQWGHEKTPIDFYDIKGLITQLLAPYCSPDAIVCKPIAMKHLHEGLSCSVVIADKPVGVMGVLHPILQKKCGLSRQVLVFEIELPQINQIKKSDYSSISKHPVVSRDLALLVPDTVTMFDIKLIIESEKNGLLKSLDLFDIYTGETVQAGCKSLALRLTFQHPERTLVEEEINVVIEDMLQQLNETHKISLR